MYVLTHIHVCFRNFICKDPLMVDDIPGSKLDLSRLSCYRVEQLKFWLACRGDSLKNLTSKAVCIQR